MGRSNTETNCIPCNNKNNCKIFVNKVNSSTIATKVPLVGKAGAIAGKKEQINVPVSAEEQQPSITSLFCETKSLGRGNRDYARLQAYLIPSPNKRILMGEGDLGKGMILEDKRQNQLNFSRSPSEQLPNIQPFILKRATNHTNTGSKEILLLS